MFYYFKDKHKLLEVKLEFNGHNYMFNSYEMELYSVCVSVHNRKYNEWLSDKSRES